MTSDYTWNADGSLDDEFVPVELVPRRFAFAAPQCIVREDGALLLVDPHEVGTWMTWMFPYASLVLDGTDGRIASTVARDVEDAESLTFGDISEVLARLRETVRADYSAAIRSEMNNVVAGIRRGWVGAPLPARRRRFVDRRPASLGPAGRCQALSGRPEQTSGQVRLEQRLGRRRRTCPVRSVQSICASVRRVARRAVRAGRCRGLLPAGSSYAG